MGVAAGCGPPSSEPPASFASVAGEWIASSRTSISRRRPPDRTTSGTCHPAGSVPSTFLNAFTVRTGRPASDTISSSYRRPRRQASDDSTMSDTTTRPSADVDTVAPSAAWSQRRPDRSPPRKLRTWLAEIA